MPDAIDRTFYTDTIEGAAFFNGALIKLKEQFYEIKHPLDSFRTLFSVDNSAGPGISEVETIIQDYVGRAVPMARYTSTNKIELIESSVKYPIRDYADGYEITIKDLNQAQSTGRPIETKKAMACKKVIEHTISNVVFNGDTDRGITGLLDRTDLSGKAAVADGTGGLKTFASKTADEIRKDFVTGMNAIDSATNSVEKATRCAIPRSNMIYLSTTPVNSTSDKTLKQFLEGTIDLAFFEARELGGAFSGSTSGFMLYDPDPDVAYVDVAVEATQTAGVWTTPFKYEVGVYCMTGGCIVQRPKAFYMGYGI